MFGLSDMLRYLRETPPPNYVTEYTIKDVDDPNTTTIKFDNDLLDKFLVSWSFKKLETSDGNIYYTRYDLDKPIPIEDAVILAMKDDNWLYE